MARSYKGIIWLEERAMPAKTAANTSALSMSAVTRKNAGGRTGKDPIRKIPAGAHPTDLLIPTQLLTHHSPQYIFWWLYPAAVSLGIKKPEAV
jgi:hypothetical protein